MTQLKSELKISTSKLKNRFFVPEKKSSDSIFVIIDMQPQFIGGSIKPILLQAFKKALAKAMEEGHYILIVNFESGPIEYKISPTGERVLVSVGQRKECSQLLPDLQHVIKDYPNKATVWKMEDSGAKVILDHLRSEDIAFSRMYVTGLNSCACVHATVRELSQNNPDDFLIELSTSCCTCLLPCAFRHYYSYPIDEICTKVIVPNLQYYKNVITDNEDNPLKTAIINNSFSFVNEILSSYEQKIALCRQDSQAQPWENILNIKRDLLLTLYIHNRYFDYPGDLLQKLRWLLNDTQELIDEFGLMLFIPNAVNEAVAVTKLKETESLQIADDLDLIVPNLPETGHSNNPFSLFHVATLGAVMMAAAGAVMLAYSQ